LSLKKEILQKNFGQHIRSIRLKKGLTQIEVSSKMNKDQQSLQRVESGNVSPSLFYLFQLANGLDISIQELMTFEIINKKKK
jgi:transcriptional regulator with XRE-family HTH domain